MPIQDFIEVKIDLTTSSVVEPKAFEDGWGAGYRGEPLRPDASEFWRDAHAMGAKRRTEGW